MQVSYCDICGIIIKPGAKKYAVVMEEIIEEKIKDYSDATDYLREYNRKYGTLKVREICEGCKKVYDYLFQMRKDEIESIKKHIEQSYKKEL